MNTFWLEWVPATVATMASLVGVLVAVGQLTSASHLRRQLKFWNEQIEATVLEQDRAVAQSLSREATAKLIALQAYPGWKLFGWVLLSLVSINLISATGYLSGTLASGNYTYRAFQEKGLDPASFILFCWSLFALALIKASTVIVRRRILASKYLEGSDLTTSKQFDEHGVDVTDGVEQSVAGTIFMMLFCLGILLLIAAVSFVVGLPPEAWFAYTFPTWVFIPAIAGGSLAALGLTSVIKIFRQKQIVWAHPRKVPA